MRGVLGVVLLMIAIEWCCIGWSKFLSWPFSEYRAFTCEDGLRKGGSHTKDKEIPFYQACIQNLVTLFMEQAYVNTIIFYHDGWVLVFCCLLTPPRSGLLFPVGKIEHQMRRSKFTNNHLNIPRQISLGWVYHQALTQQTTGGIKRRRLGECAPVYLAAVS